jgi:hypothetical protein
MLLLNRIVFVVMTLTRDFSLVQWGSSVSLVSWLQTGQGDRVRFPAEAMDVSSNLCVKTSSAAHSASCTMGTGGPFPGAKAQPGSDTDHSHPSSAEVVTE